MERLVIVQVGTQVVCMITVRATMMAPQPHGDHQAQQHQAAQHKQDHVLQERVWPGRVTDHTQQKEQKKGL